MKYQTQRQYKGAKEVVIEIHSLLELKSRKPISQVAACEIEEHIKACTDKTIRQLTSLYAARYSRFLSRDLKARLTPGDYESICKLFAEKNYPLPPL